MKKMVFLHFALAGLVCPSVFAQALAPADPAGMRMPPTKHVKSVKSALSLSTAASGAEKLSSLYGTEIEPNDENLAELSASAEKASSAEERVVAIRLLATLYTPAGAPSRNEIIRAKLRELSQISNREIATAAILRYSRLPYSPDTETLLTLNVQKGYLTNDDFYGELAHLVPFAPDGDKSRLIQKLGEANSDYAQDILASNFKSAEARAQLSSNTRNRLIATLERHQPGFSVTYGEFSLKEAIVYADWLHTVASLKADAGQQPYEAFILSQVSGKLANPKRAISFFSSPEGKAAAINIGYTKLQSTFDRIGTYLATLPYPRNSALMEFGTSVLSLKSKMKP